MFYYCHVTNVHVYYTATDYIISCVKFFSEDVSIMFVMILLLFNLTPNSLLNFIIFY